MFKKKTTGKGFERFLAGLLLMAFGYSPFAVAEQFTVVLIPDTQRYPEANRLPIWEAQMNWIATNAAGENIVYVSHLGDIIMCNGGAVAAATAWDRADTMMAILDGTNLPYGVQPGNHDYNDCPTPLSNLSNYNNGLGGSTGFNSSRYGSQVTGPGLTPAYGPWMEQYDNVAPPADNNHNFVIFESPSGEHKFVAINLAYRNISDLESTNVLNWAEDVLETYPDRKAIITSHHIGADRTGGGQTAPCGNSPIGEAFGGGGNTYPLTMWDALKDNPNVFMMVSGHCGGENHFIMTGRDTGLEAWESNDNARECMSDVHVIMSNYQFMSYSPSPPTPEGNLFNTGYMRVMRFDTDANTIDIETFSPYIAANSGNRPASGANSTFAGMNTNSASTYTIDYETPITPNGVVLLLDTSGSMGFELDGTFPATDPTRMDLALPAVQEFVDMMNMGPTSPTIQNIGMAIFPGQPWILFSPTNDLSEELISLDLLSTNNAAFTSLFGTGITPVGPTPLFTGINTAETMLDMMDCKDIVLLSDGAGNTPNSKFGNPAGYEAEKNATLAALGVGVGVDTPLTRVHAINFAAAGENDIPLLEELAAKTQGQFYDASNDVDGTGAFDPSLNLRQLYKNILADTINIGMGLDPIDTIFPGQVKSFFQGVNEHDERVSFIVGWNPGDAPLAMAVYDASGNQVLPTDPGVETLARSQYLIFSVGKAALEGAGRIGPNPWRVDVAHRIFRCDDCVALGNDVSTGFEFVGNFISDDVNEQDPQLYHYGTMVDSGLRLRARLHRNKYFVGDDIFMTARLTEGRKSLLGLDRVVVRVGAPRDGFGNYLAANPVTAAQLKLVPDLANGVQMSPLLRKVRFLKEIAGVALPGARPHQDIVLVDDGTSGDEEAGDGIYSGWFTDTTRQGTYSFYFRAEGTTRYGNPFHREDVQQRYLEVAPALSVSDLIAEILDIDDDREDIDLIRVTVTPKDRFGNFIGAGLGPVELVKPSPGEIIGNVIDNLDGSYAQIIGVDRSDPIEIVQLELTGGGLKGSFPLVDILDGYEPPERLKCDADLDNDVDRNDIVLMRQLMGPVNGNTAHLDWDGDGNINLLDMRGCQLACTLPRCAVRR